MVDFVKGGGSLIIGAIPVATQSEIDAWTLNELIEQFDASLSPETDKYRNTHYAVLDISDKWSTVATGENGKCVIAKRDFEKGRVVLLGHVNAIRTEGDNEAYNNETKHFLDSTCKRPILTSCPQA